MKINKKIFYVFIVIIIISIGGVIIQKNMIKKSKFGNNISSQEIVEYILNTNNYKTQVTVEVNSNKNTNKYILNQEYNTENRNLSRSNRTSKYRRNTNN